MRPGHTTTGSGESILNVVCELGDAEEGAIEAGMPDATGVVLFVELLQGAEDGKFGPLQHSEAVDLFPQSLAGLLEERLCQDARVSVAVEVREEGIGVERLVSEEEKG